MKVSVLITSYNRAESLQRAIDSVICQNTTFPFEIIIVDDGSTDGSADLLWLYSDRYNIRICRRPHHGMIKTFEFGFKQCAGDFIAVCDCDDYWTTVTKLQHQYDYMILNPDCGLCITKVHTDINGKWKSFPVTADFVNQNMSFDNLLRGNAYIFAQSYFIRSTIFECYINYSKFIKLGFNAWDYPLVLELINHTRFYCMDFYSAAFVVHSESFTHTNSRVKRLKYVLNTHKIKWYFILKYHCKLNTATYVIYRLLRDIYSVIFARWNQGQATVNGRT
jgi:glycosyltransferase involved in cell wall biosynthesis